MSRIIVRLIGGLGNQMFQYAAGRALADRLGLALLLDVSGFEHYGLRRYELDRFAIRAEPAARADLEAFGVVARAPTLLNRLIGRFGLRRPGQVFREASFAYDPHFEQLAEAVYLDGYWQSERYFAGIGAALREDFRLRESPDAANADMAAAIDAEPAAVSLHVRRGDYVSDAHTAQYHGVCSLDYYRLAVAAVLERVPAAHFYVFSDDPDWVAANLDVGRPLTLVRINDGDHGMYDLDLMRRCRHHVIANSSFSWWGAWLNPAPDKLVVAPQRWFAGADHDTRDLLPATWTQR